MQAENAQEWAMREKLSSEKLALERENKRMRNEIVRLEDELRERNRPPAAAVDVDTKTVQDELSCKTKVSHLFVSFTHCGILSEKNCDIVMYLISVMVKFMFVSCTLHAWLAESVQSHCHTQK